MSIKNFKLLEVLFLLVVQQIQIQEDKLLGHQQKL